MNETIKDEPKHSLGLQGKEMEKERKLIFTESLMG